MLNKNKNKSKVRISKKELEQKLKEREELARIQQDLANTRFPNRTKMSLVKRVDRLEICTTQNLAVVDRLLEFWIAKVCPFTSDHLEPTKRQEVTTTTTTEMEQQVDIFGSRRQLNTTEIILTCKKNKVRGYRRKSSKHLMKPSVTTNDQWNLRI